MKRVFALLILLTSLNSSLLAHELRPAYLELRQTGPETYEVLWKVPARGDLRLALYVKLPNSCKSTSSPTSLFQSGSYIERWSTTCESGIGGGQILIDGLSATMTDVLARLHYLDGTTQFFRVTPSEPYFIVEAGRGGMRGVITYLHLGIKHILLGVDHLLFILGLLVIVGHRWMMMFKTISAFTVAHSLTLIAATLGMVRVPIEPLSAVIALSILFLGVEIDRKHRGQGTSLRLVTRPWPETTSGYCGNVSPGSTRGLNRCQTSVTIEHPWAAAFGFGLVHGLGFASGLSVLGLPSNEIVVALLLFNVGVELGQIAFVGLYLLMQRSFRTLEFAAPRWSNAVPSYIVGSLGAYWTILQVSVLIRGGN